MTAIKNQFVALAMLSAGDTVELYQDLRVEIVAIMNLVKKAAGLNIDFTEINKKVVRVQREMDRGQAYRDDLAKIRENIGELTINDSAMLDQARRQCTSEFAQTQTLIEEMERALAYGRVVDRLAARKRIVQSLKDMGAITPEGIVTGYNTTLPNQPGV